MTSFEQEVLAVIRRYNAESDRRQLRLSGDLVRLYRECRRELYTRFIEMYHREKTVQLQLIESIISDINRQMQHYTNLAAQVRQEYVNAEFVSGQQFGRAILVAGGVELATAGMTGLINQGMIEALIGNIPGLAGRVQVDILFQIRNELAKGAVLGESIPKIAKRILGTGITQDGLKKPFTNVERRCEVIARAEIIKASDIGYEDLANRAQEFVGEEIFDAWITAGDDRVEEQCRDIAQGAGPWQSIPGYPGVYRRNQGPRPVVHTHPGCRCRRIPFLITWAKQGYLSLAELRGRI